MRIPSLVLVIVAVLGTAACGGAGVAAPTPPPVDDSAARIGTLRDAMDEVATLQRQADPALADALSAIRQLDDVVADLRDSERVDGVRDRWPRADAAFTSVQPDTLRQPLIDLALRADDARTALRAARQVLNEPWEDAYLDAEDEVLTTVRAYAESADKLAQVIARHWPIYEQAHALAAQFVEQRWFYRSSQEAADAFEVKVGGLLPQLAAARDEVGRFVDVREAAVEPVRDASATASEIWRERPEPGATPTS